jgi:methylated-DNA-[protein]-cysteine S-methyltransferase
VNVDVLGATVEIDESLIEASPAAVREQVREFEAGSRVSFDLDVTFPEGFGGGVMRAMAAIPFGETRTYGDLAADLDTAPIAVGQACGRNPVPLVVPCHRVLASDGGLRGYSADGGVRTKQRLLAVESFVAGGSR